ncbi:unnamed protein product (macronuclear) [Paramecium tetraurelia]|uniref:MalT-like TPR region domain-containing protein n=1 Tax=Paramecium tetraurelia TaxID=5888 RepID=A0D8J4_PARTE|nr:uncharacterized protein GSPATT00014307001 [Paramecium tetraurelia]CAK79361.1 unnamed protein product [Paramecium tetraurelia]|eukprot:XP_001446758.1 hypothetical protein (macronuclear) [Paramecium tetraurelia strain d4-2]
MDSIRERLLQLDQQAQQFQQQNKYLEALNVFEEMLMIKKSAYGEDSEEYFKTSDKLCELCNLIAMIFLQKEKFDASLEFLKKADMLAQSSTRYKAITYNNLACFYRRNGKLRSALQYLQQALEIEIRQETAPSLADTHLNMCAVLSQLNRVRNVIQQHAEALEHALISVVLLQDEFLMKPPDQKMEQSQNQDQKSGEQKMKDRVAVLAIAYHNLGVEFEYLKRFDEAIQTYQKAVKFGELHLPPDHQLIGNLKNVLGNAQEQINQQRAKDSNKRQQKELQSRNQNKRKLVEVEATYKQNNKKKTDKIVQHQQQQQVMGQTMRSNPQNNSVNIREDDQEQQGGVQQESSYNDHDELQQEAQTQLQQHQQQ